VMIRILPFCQEWLQNRDEIDRLQKDLDRLWKHRDQMVHHRDWAKSLGENKDADSIKRQLKSTDIEIRELQSRQEALDKRTFLWFVRHGGWVRSRQLPTVTYAHKYDSARLMLGENRSR